MWGPFLASHFWQLVLLACLLCASGFFSGTETALFSLSRGQLYRLRHSDRRMQRLVALLMDQPRLVLNTLLLSNLLVNVAYAAVVAVMLLGPAGRALSAWQAGIASLIPLLILILAGEVAPKTLALRLARPWASAVAGPLALLVSAWRPVLRVFDRLIVSPLTRLLAGPPGYGVLSSFVPWGLRRINRRDEPPPAGEITADELAALLDLSAKRGVIERDTSFLLREMLELSGLRVRDIMVPRVDMIAFEVNGSRESLAELFRTTKLRRIPVYAGDVDHILGLVHAKRLLLQPPARLRDLVVEVGYVPEAGSVERLLHQFRATRTQIAIVVDEYGGTAGLVALEDALEEIVGDLPDPNEPAIGPAVQQIGERQYLLSGGLSIHEWADAFQIDLSGGRISTVGGFVTSLLGRIPREGDEVSYHNLRFVVQRMRRRRIDKLHLQLMEESP